MTPTHGLDATTVTFLGGAGTVTGKIAHLLATAQETATPLQERLAGVWPSTRSH